LDDGHGIDQLFNLDALLDAPEPVDEGYDIDQLLDLDAFLAALNRGEFDHLHDLDLDLDAALVAVEPVDDDYDIAQFLNFDDLDDGLAAVEPVDDDHDDLGLACPPLPFNFDDIVADLEAMGDDFNFVNFFDDLEDFDF
jgi:hypothetical protein